MSRHTQYTKAGKSRLVRANVMIEREQYSWLERVVDQAGFVSKSEVVRMALAEFKERHGRRRNRLVFKEPSQPATSAESEADHAPKALEPRPSHFKPF